jgi:hypothetical protein
MVTAATPAHDARISQGAVSEVVSIGIFSIIEGFCSCLEFHREADDGEFL